MEIKLVKDLSIEKKMSNLSPSVLLYRWAIFGGYYDKINEIDFVSFCFSYFFFNGIIIRMEPNKKI